MNWQRTRLKYLAAAPIVNGLGESATLEDESWPRYIRTTDFAGPRALREETKATLPPDVARKAEVRRGDLLMSAAGTVGKTFLYDFDEPACYAGYLVRFRPMSNVDPRFVAYWTESPLFLDQVETGKVTSTIDNYSASKYQNLSISIPDRETQRAIADYLDTETARIDTLIAKKQRSIDLVRQRLNELARHLTIGQQASVPLRRVAAHVKTGGTPPAETISDEGAEWVTPGDFTEYLEVTSSARRVSPAALASGHLPTFEAGSVLIVGIGATAGRVGYVERPVSGNQQVTGIECGDSIQGEFLAWQLHVRAPELRSLAPYTTLPIINNDFLKSLPIFVTNLETQRRVIRRLRKEKERVRSLVQVTERQLALLHEHRQALIAAAVTGELEVPGVAA